MDLLHIAHCSSWTPATKRVWLKPNFGHNTESEPTAQGQCATAGSELTFAAAPLHYCASADGHSRL